MWGFTFILGEQICRWISLVLALSPRDLAKSFPEEYFPLRSPLSPEFPRAESTHCPSVWN